jgi:hypothetical protein
LGCSKPLSIEVWTVLSRPLGLDLPLCKTQQC